MHQQIEYVYVKLCCSCFDNTQVYPQLLLAFLTQYQKHLEALRSLQKKTHLGGGFECHSIVKRSIKIVAMPNRSDKKYYTRLSPSFSLLTTRVYEKVADVHAFVICIFFDETSIDSITPCIRCGC